MTDLPRDDTSHFIHRLSFDALPDTVVQDAKRRVLDLLGVAAAGSGTALAGIVREHACDCFGAGRMPARMLFDGRAVSPPGAALAGATTIDSFDGHDGHALTKGHAGVTVLPALLAMTDVRPAMSGREFLTQIVLGYELGTRAGIALHATSREYHTSGAWNALAAAALVSRSLKLGIEATRHALGIAEYHGPRSDMMRCIDHPTMVKDGSGWGAMAGVSAALLAARGYTGAPATTVETAAPECWADLGTRWRILEQYLKPYPVCRWAHPAIAAALYVRDLPGFDAEAIGHATIHTFHEATRLWSAPPANTEEAQYGVLFPVAAALANGRVDADTIDAAGLTDPRVLALVSRLDAVEHDTFNAAFPAERWARLTVQMRDGQQFDSGPMQAPGDPDRPMTPEAERNKFRSLVGARFGDALATSIETAVDELSDPHGTVERLQSLVLCAPAIDAGTHPHASRSASRDGSDRQAITSLS